MNVPQFLSALTGLAVAAGYLAFGVVVALGVMLLHRLRCRYRAEVERDRLWDEEHPGA